MLGKWAEERRGVEGQGSHKVAEVRVEGAGSRAVGSVWEERGGPDSLTG